MTFNSYPACLFLYIYYSIFYKSFTFQHEVILKLISFQGKSTPYLAKRPLKKIKIFVISNREIDISLKTSTEFKFHVLFKRSSQYRTQYSEEKKYKCPYI